MKTAVTILLSLLVLAVQGQRQYELLTLPLHSDSTVLHTCLGVGHTVEPMCELREGSAFLDTNVVNLFFTELAKQVNPDSVILVTEHAVFDFKKDLMYNYPNPWSTSTMRSLGFTKWTPADQRTSSIDSYAYATQYVLTFANEYFISVGIKDSLDVFGLPRFKVMFKKEIPQNVIDSVMKYIFVYKEKRAYEQNIKRLAQKVSDIHYTPVIITGFTHTLSLGKPCKIQMSEDGEPDFKYILTQHASNDALYKILDYVEKMHQREGLSSAK